MDIDITEYTPRVQLRALADEAVQNKRLLAHVQAARTEADRQARAGKYEMRLIYSLEDATRMVSLLRRAFPGCSIILEHQVPATIMVGWA